MDTRTLQCQNQQLRGDLTYTQAYSLAATLCRLVHEYLLLAPTGQLEDAVELLSGESLLRMLHTHDGAKVGCMVAAYGTPKDRKKLVKAFKTHVLKVSTDEFAYAALIKVLSCVDDTQLMRKGIVQELMVRYTPWCGCQSTLRVTTVWRALLPFCHCIGYVSSIFLRL